MLGAALGGGQRGVGRGGVGGGRHGLIGQWLPFQSASQIKGKESFKAERMPRWRPLIGSHVSPYAVRPRGGPILTGEVQSMTSVRWLFQVLPRPHMRSIETSKTHGTLGSALF